MELCKLHNQPGTPGQIVRTVVYEAGATGYRADGRT